LKETGDEPFGFPKNAAGGPSTPAKPRVPAHRPKARTPQRSAWRDEIQNLLARLIGAPADRSALLNSSFNYRAIKFSVTKRIF
jgi:hypothetical protein